VACWARVLQPFMNYHLGLCFAIENDSLSFMNYHHRLSLRNRSLSTLILYYPPSQFIIHHPWRFIMLHLIIHIIPPSSPLSLTSHWNEMKSIHLKSKIIIIYLRDCNVSRWERREIASNHGALDLFYSFRFVSDWGPSLPRRWILISKRLFPFSVVFWFVWTGNLQFICVSSWTSLLFVWFRTIHSPDSTPFDARLFSLKGGGGSGGWPMTVGEAMGKKAKDEEKMLLCNATGKCEKRSFNLHFYSLAMDSVVVLFLLVPFLSLSAHRFAFVSLVWDIILCRWMIFLLGSRLMVWVIQHRTMATVLLRRRQRQQSWLHLDWFLISPPVRFNFGQVDFGRLALFDVS